ATLGRANRSSMVLVGLGSNLGASARILDAALARLAEFSDGAVACSSFWRTSPVDCPPASGDFVNAVAAFSPRAGLTPDGLLTALKSLESEFGRRESAVRHAPRALDLDLLVFGNEARATDSFVLPHPRATQRRFVLVPAAEVAPALVWPGSRQTIAELCAALVTDEQLSRLERHDG
ncbi:MAG: 2-amino-4-hydroxy-6-hydroxymethyldihydropteridine diphosphokinase, partial [Pseudomonadales bacterium]